MSYSFIIDALKFRATLHFLALLLALEELKQNKTALFVEVKSKPEQAQKVLSTSYVIASLDAVAEDLMTDYLRTHVESNRIFSSAVEELAYELTPNLNNEKAVIDASVKLHTTMENENVSIRHFTQRAIDALPCDMPKMRK